MHLLFILSIMVTVVFGCAPSKPKAWGSVTHHRPVTNNYYTDKRSYYGYQSGTSASSSTTEKIPKVEEEQDCQDCTEPPEYLMNCDNCVNLEISEQYEYYGCSAITVKCAATAKTLQISTDFSNSLDSSLETQLTCQKGKWIFTTVDNVIKDVGILNCLS